MRGLWPRAVKSALWVYKATLSPLFGQACRFSPSCSVYAAEVLVAHGLFGGGLLAARRVCRCRPGGGSGYDPAPPKLSATGFTCV